MLPRRLLLVAAMTLVVAAAPAAPIRVLRADTRPEPASADTKQGSEAPRPKTGPVSVRLVLRAAGSEAPEATGDAPAPAATLEIAPAVRARRLAFRPRPSPPVRTTGAEVRAGHLALPPPRA